MSSRHNHPPISTLYQNMSYGFSKLRTISILLKTTTKFFPNSQIYPNTRRISSHQSWLSDTGKPLINWPIQYSSPQPPPKPRTPLHLSESDQNPNPNFNQNDFTAICELLSNPNLSSGSALESELEKTGIELGNSLLEEIFKHFDSSPKPLFSLFLWVEKQPYYQFSVKLFNSMINLLGKARQFDLAWILILNHVNDKDQGPDFDTFTILIRRYARAGMVKPAVRTYEYASNLEIISGSDLVMGLFEILMDSFCKEGHVKFASEYFDQKRKLDPNWISSSRVYNILLNGWFRSRILKHAERLWIEMKKEKIKPSVVTFGILIEGYCRMRRVEIAIELIDAMKKEGIEPNSIIYNSIIDALGEAGRFKEALGFMERFMVLEAGPTLSTYNSLVKGFCKYDDLIGASRMLKMMISRNILPTSTTYNYFFRYFSRFGKVEEGMNLYTRMIGSGYKPDRLTYHLLVKMLCEDGKMDLTMQILKEMRSRGFDLDLATSTMWVHLLCKMFRFEEAFGEFEDMIRRRIVPQYLTFQKMSDALKREGMIEMAKRLRDLMDSVRHSVKLHNKINKGKDIELSRERRTSIIRRAEKMSNILKISRNPREIVKIKSKVESDVLVANRLVDEFMGKVPNGVS